MDQEPSSWLNQIQVPGIPNKGIDFVGEAIVPGVINVLLFAIFVSSLIVLIVGGIMWIASGGDKEGKAKAKATVTYAIIGLVLGLASFLILNVIGQLFGLGNVVTR